jgi:hypothetical protein
MNVTSLLSRGERAHDHDHDASCASCEHDHAHTNVRLNHTIIGLLFVINSFLVEWILDRSSTVADVSAMIGAILLGFPILVTAFKDLRRGILSTNELVALAVTASFASGHYQEAGVVAFFMLIGEFIETRTAEGARASIESLIKLTPTKARRLRNGAEEEVAVKDLALGDIIRVRPGDNVAADGVIVAGQGSFNQANITGESLPVDKKTGDEVFAGTVNLTGVLEIKVNRAGQDTALGRCARTDPRRRENQAADHAHRGSIHGFLHTARAGDRRAGVGVHAGFEPRDRGLHRRVPVRVRARDADRDGRSAFRGGATRHPDQERRGHRTRREDQRIRLRQNRHAHDRQTRCEPSRAAERRDARRTSAHRRVRREIQQSSDGEGARAVGRGSRRAARRAEGFCRDRGTRHQGQRGRQRA